MLELCAGIGGAGIAAEMTGAIDIIAQVECDPFCNKILKKHWPRMQHIDYLQEVRGDEFGTIDLCVASLPCQPWSLAGQRRGTADERDLWPCLRSILANQFKRGQPYTWLVIENVKGLLYAQKGEVFKTIMEELSEMGYSLGWCVYGACEVGAPHKRERLFIVAHANCDRRWDRPHKHERFTKCEASPDTRQGDQYADVAYTNEQRWEEGQPRADVQEWQSELEQCSSTRMAYPDELRWRERQPSTEVQPGQSELEQCSQLAHADAARLAQRCGDAITTRTYPITYSDDCATGEIESAMGRDTDGFSAALDRAGGRDRGRDYRGTRWPSRLNEPQHAWEPPRTIAKEVRLKDRVARLKALGNAIVPEQIYPLLMGIVRIEREIELAQHAMKGASV